MFAVMYASILFSSVFTISERRDMGLYEVPLSVSGFRIGTMLANCMRVVNKQFELLKFVFDSVYVNLQYDEISLIFTSGLVFLCDVCSRPWSVCEVALAPYVNVVVRIPDSISKTTQF